MNDICRVVDKIIKTNLGKSMDSKSAVFILLNRISDTKQVIDESFLDKEVAKCQKELTHEIRSLLIWETWLIENYEYYKKTLE
jgi:hypothetical protein